MRVVTSESLRQCGANTKLRRSRIRFAGSAGVCRRSDYSAQCIHAPGATDLYRREGFDWQRYEARRVHRTLEKVPTKHGHTSLQRSESAALQVDGGLRLRF